MNPRNKTKFYKTIFFEKIIDGYDKFIVEAIVSHLLHFEKAWCSRHDGELPSGYYFEAYTDIDGPYRLGQIRVGPNRGYRALAMFPNGRSEAY